MVLLGACCAAASVAVMGWLVAVDVSTRRIPREGCWLLGACGALFQVAVFGLQGVVTGCFSMLATVFPAIAVGKMLHGATGRIAIGGGDIRCMAALSIATGAGSIYGAMAACLCALLCGLSLRAAGVLAAGEGFPFAPFLAVWLVAGFAYCIVSM